MRTRRAISPRYSIIAHVVSTEGRTYSSCVAVCPSGARARASAYYSYFLLDQSRKKTGDEVAVQVGTAKQL